MNFLKKTTSWIVASLCLLAFSFGYWQYLSAFPSTDDAYINANIININANVSGQVNKLLVADNQFVHKGQLLYTIDSKPYTIALMNANARLDLTKQQIEANDEAVHIAKLNINAHQSQYELDQKNYQRITSLVKDGKLALADGDKITASLRTSEANLLSAKKQYQQALIKRGLPGKRNAELRQAIANVKDAKLKLFYTNVRAPKSGIITHLSLREGDFVAQGQNNFALIEDKSYWVDANFKETQLSRIHPGQLVNIQVDMFPNKSIKGTVTSISGGTGNSFSLLPQENATGNWVKVTQRIPVRIAINKTDLPLAVGASAKVTVDTKHG